MCRLPTGRAGTRAHAHAAGIEVVQSDGRAAMEPLHPDARDGPRRDARAWATRRRWRRSCCQIREPGESRAVPRGAQDVRRPRCARTHPDTDARVYTPGMVWTAASHKRRWRGSPARAWSAFDAHRPYSRSLRRSTYRRSRASFSDETHVPKMRRQPQHRHRTGRRSFLFADIADSTALTERHGRRGVSARRRGRWTRRCGARSREHGGSVIDAKTLGDGILATFAAASQAIGAALACAAAGDGTGDAGCTSGCTRGT